MVILDYDSSYRRAWVDTYNVMVLTLDEHNEQILRDMPDAEHYRFHSVLSRAELFGGQIPLCDVLDMQG